MELWQILLTIYGGVAVAYGLRLAQIYFRFFESSEGTRNGTIIVESIIGGLKWPLNIVWNGLKETIVSVLPPKVEQPTVQVAPPPGGETGYGFPMPGMFPVPPAAGGSVQGVVVGEQ